MIRVSVERELRSFLRLVWYVLFGGYVVSLLHQWVMNVNCDVIKFGNDRVMMNT